MLGSGRRPSIGTWSPIFADRLLLLAVSIYLCYLGNRRSIYLCAILVFRSWTHTLTTLRNLHLYTQAHHLFRCSYYLHVSIVKLYINVTRLNNTNKLLNYWNVADVQTIVMIFLSFFFLLFYYFCTIVVTGLRTSFHYNHRSQVWKTIAETLLTNTYGVNERTTKRVLFSVIDNNNDLFFGPGLLQCMSLFSKAIDSDYWLF